MSCKRRTQLLDVFTISVKKYQILWGLVERAPALCIIFILCCQCWLYYDSQTLAVVRRTHLHAVPSLFNA